MIFNEMAGDHVVERFCQTSIGSQWTLNVQGGPCMDSTTHIQQRQFKCLGNDSSYIAHSLC